LPAYWLNVMQNIGPIIQSIAALAWAGFAFTALFVFRSDISRALQRFRKGKIFGQEIEFGEELEKLEASGLRASQEVDALPPEERRMLNADQEERLDAVIKSILQQAATEPKLALITLWTEMEKQARQALATRGLLNARPAVAVSQALSELQQYGFPPNLLGSLRLFDEVRNKIIHGGPATTDDDALRALDSGITILRALNLSRMRSTLYSIRASKFLLTPVAAS
jgi:hypothetical protein